MKDSSARALLSETMTEESLFEHGVIAPDGTYNAIRDNQTPEEERTRSLLEDMWRQYQPYADASFKRQIQCDFAARFWEMYLACTLMDTGVSLSTKLRKQDEGPDILAELPFGRLWVEAVTPTPGANMNADHVPALRPGLVQEVPKDKILLRYRGAIKDKHDKYRIYTEKGIAAPSDRYVIAIDVCRIPNAILDADPKNRLPLMLEAVLPVERVLQVSGQGPSASDAFRSRDGIHRASGARVDNNVFLNGEYAGISGIICAYVSSGFMPARMGDNFVLIHNPLASNPLPPGFLKVGCEYVLRQGQRGYVLVRTDWP